MDKLSNFSDTLSRFSPKEFNNYLAKLIYEARVKFKIVPGRKTKLGDFRYSDLSSKPTITVNGDLNPYSFLITSLHEIAHLNTFRKYGNSVQAHGIEWKNAFRDLLEPVLTSKSLPEDIEKALWKSFVNTKASSCSDLALSRVLKKYDVENDTIHLESLAKNSTFALNGKKFKKGDLRRSRYVCIEISTGKQFLVHALANVYIISE
jgi:SprT protein